MEKYVRKKLELAYHAHVFDVYNDHLELPDGREVVYDYIDHRAGACVLPVTDDGRLILVKQYRNSLDRFTLEIPAGGIEQTEDSFFYCRHGYVNVPATNRQKGSLEITFHHLQYANGNDRMKPNKKGDSHYD